MSAIQIKFFLSLEITVFLHIFFSNIFCRFFFINSRLNFFSSLEIIMFLYIPYFNTFCYFFYKFKIIYLKFLQISNLLYISLNMMSNDMFRNFLPMLRKLINFFRVKDFIFWNKKFVKKIEHFRNLHIFSIKKI